MFKDPNQNKKKSGGGGGPGGGRPGVALVIVLPTM